MLYPLTFHPRCKERIWGGRNLEVLYQKPLPPGTLIGESWEISDRPGDASAIANGALAGRDLRWLMEQHQPGLLGNTRSANGRFPWLFKLLDAQRTLSLQVHPPAGTAAELGGEPKTELWYVAHAAPGAMLYAGLKRGVTREQFERKLQSGQVADCFHRLPVQAGDAMFLPAGRVHAIGAGIVIFEIQQNSDTTYRVFDWNRSGLDGKPRELHVPQSLASIDFTDFEPGLVQTQFSSAGRFRIRALARHSLFKVDHFRALSAESLIFREPRLRVIAVIEKRVTVMQGATTLELRAGQFCLVPAGLSPVEIRNEMGSGFLLVEPGE